MATSFEQKRVEMAVAGMVDLPPGQLSGLTEKQENYYLSLRGAFMENLKVAMVWQVERCKKAFSQSVMLGAHVGGLLHAQEDVLAEFDAVMPQDIMNMKIDTVPGLLLCMKAGLARVLVADGAGYRVQGGTAA